MEQYNSITMKAEINLITYCHLLRIKPQLYPVKVQN